MTDTIVVPNSPLPDEAKTALRYVLTALGGILVSRGFITEGELMTIVGVVLVAGPAVWGVIKTRANWNKLTTIEPHAPADVVTKA